MVVSQSKCCLLTITRALNFFLAAYLRWLQPLKYLARQLYQHGWYQVPNCALHIIIHAPSCTITASNVLKPQINLPISIKLKCIKLSHTIYFKWFFLLIKKSPIPKKLTKNNRILTNWLTSLAWASLNLNQCLLRWRPYTSAGWYFLPYWGLSRLN